MIGLFAFCNSFLLYLSFAQTQPLPPATQASKMGVEEKGFYRERGAGKIYIYIDAMGNKRGTEPNGVDIKKLVLFLRVFLKKNRRLYSFFFVFVFSFFRTPIAKKHPNPSTPFPLSFQSFFLSGVVGRKINCQKTTQKTTKKPKLPTFFPGFILPTPPPPSPLHILSLSVHLRDMMEWMKRLKKGWNGGRMRCEVEEGKWWGKGV